MPESLKKMKVGEIRLHVPFTLLFSYAIKRLTYSEFQILKTETGRSWFTKHWKLCKPLKTSTDAIYLKYILSDIYFSVAMVNYPYPNDFLKPVPANPVSVNIAFIDKTY